MERRWQMVHEAPRRIQAHALDCVEAPSSLLKVPEAPCPDRAPAFSLDAHHRFHPLRSRQNRGALSPIRPGTNNKEGGELILNNHQTISPFFQYSP